MAQAKQVDILISGLTNSAGGPLNQGKVYFYATDGSTLKTVWVDSEKETASANPVTLTAGGFGEIFADGTYTVKITDSDGATIQTIENMTFTPSAAATTNEINASDFGTATDDNAISLAITSASGADRTVFLTPGNWSISDNLTIPSNINIKYIFGAYTTIASGKTLTINGTIDAPLYNIFRGSGTVTYDNRNLITPSIWGIGGSHDNLSLDGQILFIDNIVVNGGSSTLPILIQKTEDGVGTSLLRYDRVSASPADNDYYDIDYYSENDNNQQAQFARMRIKQLDVSDGTEKGQIIFSVADGTDGSIDDVLTLDKTGATVTGALVVSGNLTVSGTTTTVNSTTVTVDDPILTLGGDTAPGSDDNKDRGIEFRWHNGSSAKIGFFGFHDSTGKFTFIPDASNSSEVFSGTAGTVVATTFEGNLTGTINTAAQANITSLGTLTTLTVDNVIINGTTIGHTSDTDLITLTDQTVTVAGTVAATTLTGTLSTAAQTNVTSLGTLTSLAVTGDLTVDTTTLKVDSTNNRVGIRTSSPNAPLSVLSNSSARAIDIVGRSSGNIGELSFFENNGTSLLGYLGARDSDVRLRSENDLVFFSGGSNQNMTINSSGNVAIGTSSPSHRLDVLHTDNTPYTASDFLTKAIARVENNSTVTNSFASIGFRTASGDNAIGFKYTGTINQADFIIVNDAGVNGVEHFKIDSAGKVFMPNLSTSGTDNGTLKYNSSTGEIWVD